MQLISDCLREKTRRKASSSSSLKGSPISRKTFEYRLYPSPAQEKQMLATLEACRFVYNWAVEDRRNLWGYAKCSTTEFDQAGYLKHLKKKSPPFSSEGSFTYSSRNNQTC